MASLSEAVNQTSAAQVDQFRSFSKIYNNMSELCFNQCVWDFGTDQVRDREMRCALNCTEHFMKSQKQLGAAFTESQPENNMIGFQGQ